MISLRTQGSEVTLSKRGPSVLHADSTVPTYNLCTKCVGMPGIIHDRMPDCHQFPGHRCMDDLTAECSFDSQASWVIDVLGLSMSSMSVGTTKHWPTNGRLEQELNACTVALQVAALPSAH